MRNSCYKNVAYINSLCDGRVRNCNALSVLRLKYVFLFVETESTAMVLLCDGFTTCSVISYKARVCTEGNFYSF